MRAPRPSADPGSSPPVLSDGSVLLRMPSAGDAADITEACQDPEIIRFTTIPTPYHLSDARAWLAKHEPGSDWWASPTWAITQGGPRWGGTVDLRLDGAQGAEIGYLVAPWMRGHQAATRAVRLACAWGFMALGLEVIRWYANVGNEASRAVATKVGFQVHREVLRRGLAQRGQRTDGWVGDLLPEDLAEVSARRSPFSRPSLTAREREVLDLLATGQTNRSIAHAMSISENTVKNHVGSILEKLQARSRVDAVVRGVQQGLTQLP